MPVDISKIPTNGYNSAAASSDNGSGSGSGSESANEKQQEGETKEEKDEDNKTPRMPKNRGSRSDIDNLLLLTILMVH